MASSPSATPPRIIHDAEQFCCRRCQMKHHQVFSDRLHRWAIYTIYIQSGRTFCDLFQWIQWWVSKSLEPRNCVYCVYGDLLVWGNFWGAQLIWLFVHVGWQCASRGNRFIKLHPILDDYLNVSCVGLIKLKQSIDFSYCVWKGFTY